MVAELDLDADVYAFASDYASAKGIPLGAAVSELLRRAEDIPSSTRAVLITNERGLLVKAKNGRPVTPEMVKRYSEEDFD